MNTSKFFYITFVFYLWVGYFLTDVLEVSFFDELYAVMLFMVLLGRKWNKELKLFVGVMLFYVCYSFLFGANPSPEAILLDTLQQSKPYVFFYFAYSCPIAFTKRQRSVLIGHLVIFAFTAAIVGFSLDPTFYSGLFHHPTNYANSMFAYAVFILFLYDGNKKGRYLCAIILAMGLLCTRSKYYGSTILAIYFIFFCKERVKINLKYLVYGCILVAVVMYFTMEKLNMYVFNADPDSIARTALYVKAPDILMDYFPFGSGLGSYAVWFSGEYYSPIYDRYNLSNMLGLSREYYNWIADTFFPSLAQVGFVGVVLFFLFWKRRISQLNMVSKNNIHLYKVGMCIVACLAIESLAGPLYVNNYNVIYFVLLGIICRESCKQHKTGVNKYECPQSSNVSTNWMNADIH